jgi:hypothetical protein
VQGLPDFPEKGVSLDDCTMRHCKVVQEFLNYWTMRHCKVVQEFLNYWTMRHCKVVQEFLNYWMMKRQVLHQLSCWGLI